MFTERAELEGTLLDGRYQLGSCLGIGGTGVVFEATRLADAADVVVKTLRPEHVENRDMARRLLREAEVGRKVGHLGVVAALDEGEIQDGSPYVVMQRVRGESLKQLLRRSGPVSSAAAAALGIRVAAILHTVHRHGYVHRDVKPEHVLLDRSEDGQLRVALLDFGVCASENAPLRERESERGRVYGTPTYTSPEQAMGEPYVDGRADLYSLGATLFEALVGRAPFMASSASALLRRIIREDVPPLCSLAKDVDPGLEEVLGRALARDKDARFPTARAFARALVPMVRGRLNTERNLAAQLVQGASVEELVHAAADTVQDADPTVRVEAA